jgi:3-(methylthio)propionyl---CoA ligase
MLTGLMQQTPLLISGILRHAAVAHASQEIVSRLVDEPLSRYSYADFARRVAKAAHLLRKMEVNPGERVSSLAWNTSRHMELFYAVPGVEAVLHTANPRLSDDQLIYTINHAGSSALFFERSFAAQVDRIAPYLSEVRNYIMLCDEARLIPGEVRAESYEALIAPMPDEIDWPVFDENAGAMICYTSGTTGDPKGVLYSHRSTVLHAMAAGLSSALGLSAFDAIMPCSSLYHVAAWGQPFAGVINGCKFVLPCDKMDAKSLQELIQTEGVTITGGVPTIWTMYLNHLAQTGEGTAKLERVVIGGSAVPRAMAETFETKYGVKVLQLWGMTETSPIGVMATPTPALMAKGEDEARETIWTRQGRMQFGIELKIVDDEGRALPHDGETSGALMARGPWTLERYYRAAAPAVDADGWFDTGDVATIDPCGYMRITDRKKDVIKSGGEWISSIDIENFAVACPGVKIAAVVGVYHPKWEERPILIIEPHDESDVTAEAVLAFLEPHIVKWWTPDAVLFDIVPLTATGKIDKKVLRQRYWNHLAPEAAA